MTTIRKNTLSRVFSLAWQMVKRNGYTLSEALKVAWANIKLNTKMQSGITRFYFRKVDGSVREAFGTLATHLIPEISSDSKRKRNDTVQVYFDTERQEWRCYKIANLLSVN